MGSIKIPLYPALSYVIETLQHSADCAEGGFRSNSHLLWRSLGSRAYVQTFSKYIHHLFFLPWTALVAIFRSSSSDIIAVAFIEQ
jgi:hypothetical protein